jgi:uncharacterized membrane protein YjdF
MVQRRLSSSSTLKLAVVLSVVVAVLFLLSDTLFGQSDIAYFLVFVSLILFPIGLFFVSWSVKEMLAAKAGNWIRNRYKT